MTPSREPLVVAIDGPSGSGKSSLSRALAGSRGLAYLDTGAMYRALVLWCQDHSLTLDDAPEVARAAVTMPLEMVTDPSGPRVLLDGRDVGEQIRQSTVSAVVSLVATNPGVRGELVRRQQRVIAASVSAGQGIVVEGRDITTVVAPDARIRVLLSAQADARLARRAHQLTGESDERAKDAVREEVLGRDTADSTVAQFLAPADGVVSLDNTALSFEETLSLLQAMVDDADGDVLATQPEPDLSNAAMQPEESQIEYALRVGLAEFELSEEDEALLVGALPEQDAEELGPRPVVAVIGRPNVGKSTLVNRIIGRREAVVEDVPGVTRDRVAYDGDWAGRRFTVVDTGGWEIDATGIHLRVAEQAEIAIELADAVLFIVDATVGATDTDEQVVRLLRRSGKPVVLVANKVDDMRGESDAAALWSLGLGQPWPVSALHGRGSGDVLDALLEVLPEVSGVAGAYERGGPRRIALLGRPNVGKSSLLNTLAGQERVVVDEVAGTTRDPVDEQIELGGRLWTFVDTAGIRRRVRQTRGADFYASLRTQTALEKAEVAVVLIDAAQPMTEQDVRVIQQVVNAGRALVLAYNKWDLLDEERRHYLEREIERDLAHVSWAPRVNISARTGRHKDRLVPALDAALEGWSKRVPTGRLNAFLGEVVAGHPHPVRSGKQPRILFATQASTCPPRFVVFASGFLEAGYRRFLERRLREEFGFTGSPIEISVRVREKRRRGRA
ncbi:MAG: bifunctional cytidylate kinase/GTPase Der [Austwickia sp.]|nr:bifunctional cytidylate kinase/GTPase Der [Austwickia sp.]